MLLIGLVLLILCTMTAMQTREFISTAQPAEGKFSLGDATTGRKSTKRYIEFWVKNKDYQPPKDAVPSVAAGLSPETQMLLTKSHTRYRFATNALIDPNSATIPILYDPQSLSTATGDALYKDLDSSRAMVNAFTSLYAYSIFLFIPGSLFFAGSLIAFFKSKYRKR